MSKMNSHCLLLLTLVFSTAHAPSFHFWRNTVPAEEAATGLAGAPRASSAGYTAALHGEFGEDDDLKRFQLDELYLPKLDVSLPEVFDWNDLDREYLAGLGADFDASAFDPHRSRGASVLLASLGGGSYFASVGGSSGGGSRSAGAVESSVPTENDSSQTGKGEPSSTSPNDESSTGDSSNADLGGNPITDTTPVPTLPDPIAPQPEPIPVPAPGTFALFVLGLAGLRLAGRNKKQKRLAAS